MAGDFDGDRRTDLAVANYGSDDVSVLLGRRRRHLPGPGAVRGGDRKRALVAGDLDGDGRTDLAVANYGSGDVSVLLGKGDGTFRDQVRYAAGDAPSALVAGDFDGDGRTDLAVANYGSDDVSVLLGNGDGTFRDQVRYAAGAGPLALVAGDLDGDGRTDLAVANYGSGDVSVLLGNGDGTFRDQVRYAAGDGPPPSWRGTSTVTAAPTWPSPTTAPTTCRCCWATATAPSGTRCGTRRGTGQCPRGGGLNGDGRTDLAVANYGSGDVSVLLGRGDGTFRDQVRYAAGTGPSALVAGDFNGDGRTDLAVANQSSGDVSVLLGNGDGTFQDQVRYAAGDAPFALVAGDFNGDGRTDLAVANYGSDDVSVLLGNGDGTFRDQVRYAAGVAPYALVAGDFDGDGRTDLAVANYGSHDVSVLLGNGDGTFRDQVRYAAGDRASALVAGDFDGDGRTDLAVANQDSHDVSVLLGNGDGTFRDQMRYAAGAFPAALVSGDFDGDGRTDLAVANFGSGDVSVLLGKGDGTFRDQVRYAAGTGQRHRGGGLRRRRPHRPGRRQLGLQRRVGVAGQRRRHLPGPGAVPGGGRAIRVVTGDFNGDGRTDLAVANQDSNDVSVLLSLNGTFAASGPFAINPHATPLVTHLSGDGADDVMVINGAGDILWRKGRPQEPGTFDPPITINPGHPPGTSSPLTLPRSRARQCGRHRQRDLVVRLARRQLRPDRVAFHRFVPGEDRQATSTATDGTTWWCATRVTATLQSFSATVPGAMRPATPSSRTGDSAGRPRRSDVTLADVDQDRVSDIIVTNKVSGEVGVLRPGCWGLRPGRAVPSRRRPVRRDEHRRLGDHHNPGGDLGRGRRLVHPGQPSRPGHDRPRLQHIQPAEGLGAGRFANPIASRPSPARRSEWRTSKYDGIPDLIVLGSKGLSIFRGDGQGGFLPPLLTMLGPPPPA